MLLDPRRGRRIAADREEALGVMVAVFRIRSAFSSAANALARLSPPASVTKSIYTLVSPLRSDMRARRAALAADRSASRFCARAVRSL